ncbi:phosphate/phosphite/phosphonate ABC transporter substrate-binding protein [Shewanella violacea]|uniref:Phosphate ABC transporter, periplasmic phosphate-binding protein, putative n=1 Tax=Shewanella violacea (strain JCM 10179 / CIP 106290 / LMG 19151 / DSS12) TaxID=637905 RepID=D4ZII6_SHEVD|nr:phosphate/phosphite/phosphonate ABC transporter substrate-binding protein [Shewanella violacea]BAJ01485.1 phosphate ABC transporter, periplasmic phosphate-binding protein, putative [Shewanella violacea DSS12]
MKISQCLNTYLFYPIVLFFLWCFTTQAADTKHTVTELSTLTFGVVPQQAASMLARKWSPLLAALSQNANYQLHFATAPDIPTFEKRLAKGEYDIAYMNPYHFTVFNESPGYQALVKEKGKKIKGIIVVQKISTAQSLSDLNGELLAFPARAAFAASVLPRANLKIKGIDNQIKYVGSHDSVYLAVAQGLVAGGGGVKRTFKTMDKEVTSQLRVLWVTPGYTPHAVAIHPRVSLAIKEELTEKFTQLSSTQAGAALLEGLGFKPFEAATSRDWDDVRALGLGDFSKPLENNEE